MTSKATERDPDEVDRILDEWRTRRPDLDPTPMGVFGRIARVAALASDDLTRMLADFNLTPASFDVLANLRRSDPPHEKTPTELAASSMMSTGGMTFRVDKLEQAGLVTRRPSPTDRRVVYVRLTPAGTSLIDEVMDVHLDRERTLLQDISAGRLAQLAEALADLEVAIARSLDHA